MNKTRTDIRILILLGGIFASGGCAKLEHMDQLLTLQDLSREKDRMDTYVEAHDKRFKALVEAYQNQTLGRYKNKNRILRKFGEPVYKDQVDKEGRSLDLWVYRYAVKYIDSDKVYLYFDAKGDLVSSGYFPAPL